MEILLASASPRRRELITNIGIPYVSVSVDCDESVAEGIEPREAAITVAMRKAQAARSLPESEGRIIVSVDTMVVCDGVIFGKPCDEDDARRMLRLLSGKEHSVLTAVCIITPDGQSLSFCEGSQVRFYSLTEDEINNYVATGEPMDKAGAYGIQGKGMMLVREIEGDFYNIVGLPVARLGRTLKMVMSERGDSSGR